MSLAQASASHLKAVKNVLQDPLTGKKVMIPFTSKAFFEGTLQPTVSNGQEQVLVKLSRQDLVETTRKEAIELLERRIKSVQEKVKKVTIGATPTKNQTSTAKKAANVSTNEPASGALPFFEIREELDNNGKEVKSEAINVVKELEYLERKEDENVDAAFRAPTVVMPDDDGAVTFAEDEAPKAVSQERLDDIAARQEELMRLEEESEAAKKVNLRSAKKLQGSGWGKGFLNKKPKKTAPKKAEQPQTLSSEISATKKQVGFQEGNNEIREIPRVGERSVASLQPPPSSRQIETSVFSGVIQERPVGSGTVTDNTRPTAPPSGTEEPRKLSRFAQQRMENQGQETKKVSKFAQQRQQIR